MFELSGVNYEEVLEQGDSILVRVIASSSYRDYIVYIYTYIIHIKSKLGITHFAHNYMETSHVASKPKLLKTLARSGI